jgi:hypothetical protein
LSELSNDPPIPEDADNNEVTASSRTMLVTMILLISGFLMAGTMMIHYSSKKVGSAGENKNTAFSFSAILSQGKEYAEQLQKPKAAPPVIQLDETAKQEEQKRSALFGKRDAKVNWPKLKVTGFGSSTSGGGDFAIINGKQILQGQLIDGKAKLAKIRSHDVIMEYKGETKTLSVDVKD